MTTKLHQAACRRPFTACSAYKPSVVQHAARLRVAPPVQALQQFQQVDNSNGTPGLSRRQLIGAAGFLAASAASFGPPMPARAFQEVPDGFKGQVDRLDGYSFIYPEQWAPVTSSGNDIFLRNPFNVDQNLFVDISSPSSSQYTSVMDLGSPEDAAARILDQYLNKEFMSTRIGIKRTGEVLGAGSRQGMDGKTYYDIEVRMASYASRNPYVATQGEVMSQYGLEWDRHLLTTLGVANKRLYELRVQTGNATYEQDKPVFDAIKNSFKVVEVEQK